MGGIEQNRKTDRLRQPGLSSDPVQLVVGGWFVIAIINVINASPAAATQASGCHPDSGLFGRMCA